MSFCVYNTIIKGGDTLKDRIRLIRKTLKLTQADFGSKVGVKGNTITNYENGLRTPSEAVIFSICREFNVSEEWLRTGNGDMFQKRTKAQELADLSAMLLKDEDTSFRKRLILALAKLDSGEWAVLEKLANELVHNKED